MTDIWRGGVSGPRAPVGARDRGDERMPRRRSINPRSPSPHHRSAGFTLLETALATVVIGVGVLAVVEAQQSFLQRNSWSTAASTASYLANEVRERSKTFTRHDRFAGGLYFLDEDDPSTLRGWGPETGEAEATDLNDLDDLDGAVFGSATNLPDGFTLSRRYPGPINAFAEIIPETLYDGTMELAEGEEEGEQVAVALRGWTQIVTVRKVNPYDMTEVLANSAVVVDEGVTVRTVDRYPLRVTVTILYQPDPNENPPPVATISWIASP